MVLWSVSLERECPLESTGIRLSFCRVVLFSGYVCGDIMAELIFVYRNKISLDNWHRWGVRDAHIKTAEQRKMI